MPGKVKTNRDAIITEMISDMEFGFARVDVMASFFERWQLTDRTFDRYWAEAKKQFQEEQDILRQKRLTDKIEAQHDRVNFKIMSKYERMQVLTSIADGTLQYKKQVVTKMGLAEILVVPDPTERKAAISELNKMDGDYAPVKKDITSGGKEIKAITGIEVK